MSSRDPREGGTPPLPPGLDPRGHGTRQQAPSGAAGTGTGGRRGMRIALNTTRGVAAALSLIILLAGGWISYLHSVAEANITRSDAIPSDGNVDSIGDGEAMNILLVGNDSRGGASDEELMDKLRTEASSGLNTDTMILVHIPANGSKASLVSFPRDSWIDVPGIGNTKLNAAYANGYLSAPEGSTDAQKEAAAQQLLVQTISKISGVKIDHYLEVDLLGFYNLTEVLGGIEVNLCNAVQDDDSGIDLPAGVQTIRGADALAFVRQRKGLPNGDLDRIARQQYFIGAVVRKVLSAGTLLNPIKQKELIEAAGKNITVDQNLDLFDLAGQLQNLAAGNVEFRTIPLGDPQFGNEDGQDVVYLAPEDQLAQFFSTLSQQTDAPPAEEATGPQPSQISVEVLNGTPTSGLAGDVAGALAKAGFTVTAQDNADRNDYAETLVLYPPGQDAEAALVAAAVPGSTPQEDAAAGSVIRVVIGANFPGLSSGNPDTGDGAAPPGDGAAAEPPPPDLTAADTACIN